MPTSDQFLWNVFTIVVALVIFAFIAYIVWLLLSLIKDGFEKAEKKDLEKKKAAELKAIKESNDSWYLNGFYNLNLRKELKEQLNKPSRPVRHYKMIYFETKFDATRVLCMLERILDDYGVVTVADYYSEAGDKSELYSDHKWGWVDLSTARVSCTPGGYIITLGYPKLID